MTEEVMIACKGVGIVGLADFDEFQGELKKLPEENYVKLKKSLLDLGFSSPFHLWRSPADGRWKTIDGHQRRRALERMRDEGAFVPSHYPYVEVMAPDEQTAKKKILALVAQYGQLDQEGLREFATGAGIEFKFIEEHYEFPEVDLPAFVEAATPKVVEPAEPPPDVDPDAVPEQVETRAKPGDLWQLGKHRLFVGDSTNVQHIERLMGDKKAQTFFSDPPYGDNVGGLESMTDAEYVPGKSKVKRKAFIANDKKIDWLEGVFNVVPTFLEEPSTKMVFFKWDKYPDILQMAAAFGRPSACCVWDRVRRANDFFRFQPQHEFCLHWGNQQDKKEPLSLANVWHEAKEKDSKELHPTVKPLAILEPAIRVTTDKGKIVLDLFGGSGSTLVACEKTGRVCYMMELEPKYADVILTRWETLTGKKAVLAVDK